MSIILTKDVRIAGSIVAAGATVRSYAAELEGDLVARGVAIYASAPSVVDPVTPSAEQAAAVVGAGGRAGPLSSVRADRRVSPAYPIDIPVRFRSPFASIDLTSAPMCAVMSFGEGEVWYHDQIQVLDPTGSAVSWQWEDAVAADTEVSIAYHADGSIRAGYIWILNSLTGGATESWTVRVHANVLGQSFAQAVTYTAVSGSIDELATTADRLRMESGQGWMPRRFQDIGNSSQDLFLGANGLYWTLQESTGAPKFSYNAGEIEIISRGRIGASSFGYGVVFQEYETQLRFLVATDAPCVGRFRLFANGQLNASGKIVYATARETASKFVAYQMICGSTALTATVDLTNYFKRFDYSTGTGSRWLAVATDIMRSYPGEASDRVHTVYPFADTSASTDRFAKVGWSGVTALTAGATFRYGLVIKRYASGDSADEFARIANPVVAIPDFPQPKPHKRLLSEASDALITEAIDEITGVSTWIGVRALLRLAAGVATPQDALAEWQSWATARNINPASAASWLARWTTGAGSIGFEFTGRNAQALPWLYSTLTAAGDTANAALVKTYIDAYADFCVSAETISGGAGEVKLREDDTQAAWNAATTCLAGLGASIALGADAGRQTVFDRILAAYAADAYAGQKWTYNASAGLGIVPVAPQMHYYGYQTFELACAKRRLSSMTLPVGSLCSYIRESTTAEGYIDEWRRNQQVKRGVVSTTYYLAACLVLLEQDFATAYELLRHVAVLRERYSASGIDAWGASGLSDMAMDARALAELKLQSLI